MKAKVILALIMFVMFPELASAYTITGKVIDSKKEPMTGAGVVLYRDSATIVESAMADVNGRFALSCNIKGNLRVVMSMIGMVSSSIQFESSGNNIDLGVITLSESPTMLGEVEVVAQNVVEKGCNYLVYPSAKEIKQSSTSLDLLESLQYKLPGLQVNSSLGRVSIENGTAIFQINGRKVDFSRIQSLNNDNILRIEYSNVSDIRYGTNVMGVINYITKPTSQGGSVLLNTLLAKGFINANASVTYNYGKSEWTLDYGNSWRDLNKVYNKGYESFIGRSEAIKRENIATPSALNQLKNNLSLGYTYMYNPVTMFAVTLGGSILDRQDESNSQIRQSFGQEISDYLSSAVDNEDKFTPNIDVYFRRQVNKTSKIELNAYGNISSSDMDKALDYKSNENLYSQYSVTDNSSWRAGAEALYTKLYSRMEMKYGVNYYHNYAENTYTLNDHAPQISKQDNDNLYLHGSLSGKISNVTYSLGVGGRYYRTDNGDVEMNTFKLNGKATINYKVSSKWSVNYLFMLDPSMPSLSSQSDVVQRLDDISYSMGNPNLKASTYFRNRVYVRYATPMVNASFWASHSRNIDPIYSRYSLISDVSSPYYNMFMSQSVNAKHDDLVNFELQAGYTGIKNMMIYGVAGWDRYTFSGFGDVEPFENFYANVTASYAIKNWKLSGRLEIKPRYSLTGNMLKTPERCNAIILQYKWSDFWFTAGVLNPFSKRGVLYKSKELSTVHPTRNDFYLNSTANMVTIGITYRVNFGKKFNKAKQGLKNDGIDSGVEKKSKMELNF